MSAVASVFFSAESQDRRRWFQGFHLSIAIPVRFALPTRLIVACAVCRHRRRKKLADSRVDHREGRVSRTHDSKSNTNGMPTSNDNDTKNNNYVLQPNNNQQRLQNKSNNTSEPSPRVRDTNGILRGQRKSSSCEAHRCSRMFRASSSVRPPIRSSL